MVLALSYQGIWAEPSPPASTPKAAAPGDKNPALRLGGMTQADSALTPRLRAFYGELGRRISRQIVLVDAPLERLARDMADGKLEGLAYRSRMIESSPLAKGLRRVPVSVGGARMAVYSLDTSAPCMNDWKDLAKQKGRFTQMRGYAGAMTQLDSLNLRERLVTVDSVGQALRLLSAGRTRFAVEVFDIMEARIRSGSAPKGMRFLGSLKAMPVYLYLPAQDSALFNRSISALHDMIADRRIPKLLPDAQPALNPKQCSIGEDLVGLP